jgi:hypothetical protein
MALADRSQGLGMSHEGCDILVAHDPSLGNAQQRFPYIDLKAGAFDVLIERGNPLPFGIFEGHELQELDRAYTRPPLEKAVKMILAPVNALRNLPEMLFSASQRLCAR